jgi:hypothetical protein
MNSSKMSYTKNLLSSLRSLKNKKVLANNGGGGGGGGGGELKEVGQVLENIMAIVCCCP